MSSTTNQIIEDVAKVAIIGRPNVGKSTLFNILTETRKAVVKNQPGVTRDIQIEPCEIWGKKFDLIDTGGITEAGDIFSKLIREQVQEFLHSVDYIIAVMDGRAGLVPEDRDIIRIAQQMGKPFLLVINKVDSIVDEEVVKGDFYEFGVDMIVAAFEQRRGLAELMEWLHKSLPENTENIRKGLTISIVGKPNVGKSSMTNRIVGSHRMIVSDVAGTTVDSIDSPFVYNGKQYILVDTAGLRRNSKREDDVEIIAAFKSQDSIRRSDLVLLMIDGMTGPTEQDAKILEAILESHKAVVIVANKTDIAHKEVPEFRKTFRDQVERHFHFYTDVPVIFTSAVTGHGVNELFDEIERIGEKINIKIGTSELNDFFFETIRKAPAPVWGNNNVKFYYLTQTNQTPPAFIAFANHPDGVTNAYRRFLIKNLKERFELWGVPIRIFCMKTRKGGE